MLLIIQELFEANIDLNKPSNDKAQYSPLHSAARRALPKIVQWLLHNGADPLARDITKKTPIEFVNKAITAKIVMPNSERIIESGEMILNHLHEIKRMLTHTNQLCLDFARNTS